MGEQISRKKVLMGFVNRVFPQVIFFIISCAVFGVVLFLTYQSLSYYWYGVQLVSFFFVISLFIQLYQYRKDVMQAAFLEKEKTPIDEKDYVIEVYQEKYQELLDDYYSYKQKEADKQSEQMDYFSLWLHQIKTPISAISVLLQKMEEETSEKKTMEEELVRLTDYTHLVLNYLKLEDVGKELEIEPFYLNDVISEALKKYSIFFIYRPVQLEYHRSKSVIESDRKWIQVLVEQILSNSLKYTPKGIIKVYTKDQALVIEDTGSGISKEDLPKIFEKGYTGWNGRLHEKSTGIGLFISKKIADRLNHELRIESEVGIGTKVTIDFSRQETTLFD